MGSWSPDQATAVGSSSARTLGRSSKASSPRKRTCWLSAICSNGSLSIAGPPFHDVRPDRRRSEKFSGTAKELAADPAAAPRRFDRILRNFRPHPFAQAGCPVATGSDIQRVVTRIGEQVAMSLWLISVG